MSGHDTFLAALFRLRAAIGVMLLRYDASISDRETYARQIAANHRSVAAELQRLKDESEAEAAKWDRIAAAENGKRRGETQLTISGYDEKAHTPEKARELADRLRRAPTTPVPGTMLAAPKPWHPIADG